MHMNKSTWQRYAAIGAIIFAGSTCFAKTELREEKISMKTYGYGDPNPTPYPPGRMYPYHRFDGYEYTPTNRLWQSVVLENDKVAVTIFPEIGGKVWGAIDKKTGKDFVYYNNVVKFRNIAMRGPWTAGGIEFNFGVLGHAATTSAPVDYYTRKNADGSASCYVSYHDWISRTLWMVEIRVGADDNFFTTRTTWFNGSQLDQPYYQWMNAAYKAGRGMQVFFPGSHSIAHEGVRQEYPVDEKGRDLSVYANNAFGGDKSCHVVGGDSGFYGAYWHDDQFGTRHDSPTWDRLGRKIWFWSQSRAGGIWEDLLTDTDGQYTELQAGRMFTQPTAGSELTPFKNPSFAPGATDVFIDRWSPVYKVEELQVGATTEDLTERPHLPPPAEELAPDSAYALYLDGEQSLNQRDWLPAEKKLRASLAKEPWFAPALNRLASLLLREGRYQEARETSERALRVNAYDSEANYLCGLACDALGKPSVAKERLGIAAYSPTYRSPAYVALGMIFMREGKWENALELAERSLQSNTLNLDALLMRMICCRKLGHLEQAKAFQEKALDVFPLFHSARFEQTMGGNRKEFTKYVNGELPQETYADMAIWYQRAGCIDEALEILSLAPAWPLIKYHQAYLLATVKDNAKAAKKLLTEGTKLSPDFVVPFRPAHFPMLEWVCKQTDAWQPRYYLALLNHSCGNKDEALRLAESCKNVDYMPFYRYRALLKPDAEAEADILTAKKVQDNWRVGFALMNCYDKQDKEAELYATGADYAKRMPKNNFIAARQAWLLVLQNKPDEALKVMAPMNVIPYEGASSEYNIYRGACLLKAAHLLQAKQLEEAAKLVHQSQIRDERLGAGKPYEDLIDYRMDNYLLAVCNPDRREEFLKKLADHPVKEYAWFNTNDLLSALALRELGKTKEADAIAERWTQKFGENPNAQWCLAVYRGEFATAKRPPEKRFEPNDIDANAVVLHRLFGGK